MPPCLRHSAHPSKILLSVMLVVISILTVAESISMQTVAQQAANGTTTIGLNGIVTLPGNGGEVTLTPYTATYYQGQFEGKTAKFMIIFLSASNTGANTVTLAPPENVQLIDQYWVAHDAVEADLPPSIPSGKTYRGEFAFMLQDDQNAQRIQWTYRSSRVIFNLSNASIATTSHKDTFTPTTTFTTENIQNPTTTTATGNLTQPGSGSTSTTTSQTRPYTSSELSTPSDRVISSGGLEWSWLIPIALAVILILGYLAIRRRW